MKKLSRVDSWKMNDYKHSSSPTRIQSLKSSTKKRVHFASLTDDRGKSSPVGCVYSYPAVPTHLYSEVYWSATEFEAIKTAGRKLALVLVATAPHLVDCIHHLHLKPNHDTTEQAKEMLARFSLSRGLENWLMPEAIAEYRQCVNTKLLDVQEQCLEMYPDRVEYQLYVWSERLGKPSRRFARHLAEMDEEMEAFDRIQQ
jgi:hypothetical protein